MKKPERLKAAIAESGMKRSELARAADVEESALSKFVHGKRSISLMQRHDWPT